ncbi:MAG: helix-turn-helix domain-containing protein [Puniceicoccaceae bacterium]|nr:MAG: helix-turn-helix domain-containing protein [Puniceicoccaceae bacterium]
MVAVAFDLNFRHAAEIFAGVTDYLAQAKLDWQLLPLNFGFEERLMQLAASGKLSGVIGSFVSDRWVAALRDYHVEAVNLFQFSEIRCIPSVSVDDFALGVEAGRHLQAQAARSYAIYSADRVHYNQLRRAGFMSVLPGERIQDLRAGPPVKAVLAALAELPRPVGVFCASDRLARDLIIAARNLGWQIGQDLLVLGVGNEPPESIFAEIGISSFQLPTQEIGYRAARRLDQLKAGKGDGEWLSFASPAQLISRESSLAPGPARLAQRAANYIQEHLGEATLDVGSLAETLGVSRRSLEQAFRAQFKTSPYRKLSEHRLKLARELLNQSTLPVMEVGHRCGYPEPHHFSAWFKKQSGHSPKAFRTHPS